MNAPQPSLRQRAGLVSRLAAFFIDAIILSVSLRGTAWLLRGSGRMLGRFAPPVNFSGLIYAWAPLLVAIYLVGFWTAFGRTPGKWLMGLEVIPIGGGGLKPRRALLRLVGYLFSALPLYLGFLWILGPERRGWHDRLARTEVVYVRRPLPATTTATELRERMRRAVTRERPVASRRAGPPRASGASSRP